MRKTTIVAITFAALLLFAAARMIEQKNAPILAQLGLTPDVAQKSVWNSFDGGYFAFPRTAQMKALSPSERAKATRELGAYAKSVTTSPEFLKSYQERRESAKPSPPEPYKSASDLRKEAQASMKTSIEETEKSIAQLGPENKDMAAMLKESVATMKVQLKEYDNPNHPSFGPEVEKMLKAGYEQTTADYKKRVAEWETEWPPQPDKFVAKRLQEFLDMSKDVDFGAKLVDGPKGLKKFADQNYETKSNNWKMCYRAGKEATDAARGVAQGWVKELSRAK